jgi:tripartite-type tricarboxylate transporter receptor subunit TctC
VEAKTVKLIGVSSLKRSPLTPDWPTLDESGLPGFELVSWIGLMGPARTPPDVVARLNRATNEALADPAVRARLEQIGYTIAGGSPEDYVAAIRNDIARFKALNITID